MLMQFFVSIFQNVVPLQLFELINFLMENFVFTYIGISLFTFRNHSWELWFIVFAIVSFAYVTM